MLLFIVILGILGFLGFLYGGALFGEHGVIVAVGISIPVSFVVAKFIKFLLNKLGMSGDLLFGGREPQWDTQEQFSAYVSQAKHAIEKEDFNAAMTAVNNALKQDSNWPEALLIKAKIMWEGFENLGAAKRHLKQVIKLTSEKDQLNEQALALYNELEAIEKSR